MAFLVLLLTLMGRKINLSERLLLKESLNLSNFGHVIILLKRIFKYTLLFEIIGALLLTTQFVPEFGFSKGLFYSLFHSISRRTASINFCIRSSLSISPYKLKLYSTLTT